MIDATNKYSTLSSPLTMLAVVMLAAAGCGPRIPPPPTTQPVRGTVTLNGQPVTKGFVRFVPEPGGGRFAEGMIAEDGSYAVTAFKGQAGTLPGEYKVYFSAIQQAAEGEGFADPLPLPQKYLRLETTDLKVTVSDGDNEIPLELQGETAEEEAAE